MPQYETAQKNEKYRKTKPLFCAKDFTSVAAFIYSETLSKRLLDGWYVKYLLILD